MEEVIGIVKEEERRLTERSDADEMLVEEEVWGEQVAVILARTADNLHTAKAVRTVISRITTLQ